MPTYTVTKKGGEKVKISYNAFKGSIGTRATGGSGGGSSVGVGISNPSVQLNEGTKEEQAAQAQSIVQAQEKLNKQITAGEVSPKARVTDLISPKGDTAVRYVAPHETVTRRSSSGDINAKEAINILRQSGNWEAGKENIVRSSPSAMFIEGSMNPKIYSEESIIGGIGQPSMVRVPETGDYFFGTVDSGSKWNKQTGEWEQIRGSSTLSSGRWADMLKPSTQDTSVFGSMMNLSAPIVIPVEPYQKPKGFWGKTGSEYGVMAEGFGKTLVGGLAKVFPDTSGLSTNETKESWVYNLGVYKWARENKYAKHFLIEPEYSTWENPKNLTFKTYFSDPGVQTVGFVAGIGAATTFAPAIGGWLSASKIPFGATAGTILTSTPQIVKAGFSGYGLYETSAGVILRNPERTATGLFYLSGSFLGSPLKFGEYGKFEGLKIPFDVPSQLKRPWKYLETVGRLEKQYGKGSIEVADFKEAWSYAFHKMPRNEPILKSYDISDIEAVKGVGMDLGTQRKVVGALGRYETRIIGSSTLKSTTFIDRPPRGFFGDIDAQASLNSEMLAAEVAGITKGYGGYLGEPRMTAQGRKYYANIKGFEEFANIGTSPAYWYGQVGPTMGWLESPAAGWVRDPSGVWLSSAKDQLRIKIWKGYVENARPKDVTDVLGVLKSIRQNPEYYNRDAFGIFKKMFDSKAGRIGGVQKPKANVVYDYNAFLSAEKYNLVKQTGFYSAGTFAKKGYSPLKKGKYDYVLTPSKYAPKSTSTKYAPSYTATAYPPAYPPKKVTHYYPTVIPPKYSPYTPSKYPSNYSPARYSPTTQPSGYPPNYPSTFTPPYIPPKKPFIPKFKMGNLIKKGKKSNLRSNFKSSYFPSLEAEVFKIKGPKASTRSVATGLFTRPIAR